MDRTDEYTEATPTPPQMPRWYEFDRSSDDRLLGGVCGGLAVRWAVPTLLVRTAFILLGLIGVGVPLYVLSWVLVPTERGARVLGRSPWRDLLGVGAMGASALLALDQVGSIDIGSVVSRLVPAGLLLAGLALLLRGDGPRRSSGQLVTPGVAASDSSENPQPIVDVVSPSPPPPPPQRPPRPRPVLGPLTWCVVLIVSGALGLAVLGGWEAVNPGMIAAVALVLFGGGLALSAVRGRARGLILPAAGLTVLLAGLGALDLRVDRFAGSFSVDVADAANVPKTLAATGGDSLLDLRSMQLRSDRTISASSTTGRIRVMLPISMPVKVIANVGLGEVVLSRPNAAMAASALSYGQRPELLWRWLDKGARPKEGDAFTSKDLAEIDGRPLAPWSDSWFVTMSENEAGMGASMTRQFGRDPGPQLTLDLRVGVGSIDLYDPHWTGTEFRLREPQQACAVAGDGQGATMACTDVPEASRVPVCLPPDGYDGPPPAPDEWDTGSSDTYRVDRVVIDCNDLNVPTSGVLLPGVQPACWGFDGNYMSCEDIDPELVVAPPGSAIAPQLSTTTTTTATTTTVPSTPTSDPTPGAS